MRWSLRWPQGKRSGEKDSTTGLRSTGPRTGLRSSCDPSATGAAFARVCWGMGGPGLARQLLSCFPVGAGQATLGVAQCKAFAPIWSCPGSRWQSVLVRQVGAQPKEGRGFRSKAALEGQGLLG